MNDQSLIVSKTERVLTLTLNRPLAFNAMSPDMAEGIIKAIEEADDIDLCIFKGEGKNFCAGFDLSDISELSDADLLYRFLRIETMLQLVHHAPFYTLALAQGHVVGAGADLFAACNGRIADPSARFKMPGWNFGLALGTRRLKSLIGADAARNMLIDTRSVDAPEAFELGLCSQILGQGDWEAETHKMSSRCSKLPQKSREHMLSLTATDTRDADIAAVVHSAGRPGLKQRIMSFQKQTELERKARREKNR